MITDRIKALRATATRWREPDDERRHAAVHAALDGDARWTEASVAFAINQVMEELRTEGFAERFPPIEGAPTAAVLHGTAYPLQTLRVAAAAWVMGYTVRSVAPSPLLPAFLDDLAAESWTRGALTGADRVVLGAGTTADPNVLPDDSLVHRVPDTPHIAVLDGHETDDERLQWAEDVLLFDNTGPRRVTLVWAPAGCSPDPYFDALAQLRGLFPGHDATPGALQMQQAFLEATDQPHAYDDALTFLISRGAPEVQSPGHIRWVEYASLNDVETAGAHVVARTDLSLPTSDYATIQPPGHVHRPTFDAPAISDACAFLSAN